MNKKPPVQSQSARRREFQERIREADFPKDFGNDDFTWAKLDAAGLLKGYSRGAATSEDTFRRFILLVTQAKELRKQRDALNRQIKRLKPSALLWEAAWNEPCPIKEAELVRNAAADQARRREQRDNAPLEAFNVLSSALASGKFSKDRDWEFRDERPSPARFRPVLWHEPMSTMDYYLATGESRRTIKNMLDRLGARPVWTSKRRNQAPRYGCQTNHAVLCDWLIHHVADKDKRRGWLARTLVHCLHSAQPHFDKLYKSIRPVLNSLDIKSRKQRLEFESYLVRCYAQLHPPPPPPLSEAARNLLSLANLATTQ